MSAVDALHGFSSMNDFGKAPEGGKGGKHGGNDHHPTAKGHLVDVHAPAVVGLLLGTPLGRFASGLFIKPLPVLVGVHRKRVPKKWWAGKDLNLRPSRLAPRRSFSELPARGGEATA